MLYNPYVTADTDLSEAELDWSEFDPTAGTGSALISAEALAHEAAVYANDPTGGSLGRYA
jgi:hypothetical protein